MARLGRLAGVVASLFAVGVGVPANRPDGARGAIVRWGHAWLTSGIAGNA